MSEFWSEYGDIQKDIIEVKERIRKNLKGSINNGLIKNMLDHLLETEGKCLRAGLTILTGKIRNGDRDRMINAAAAFEMLHMATLAHDDVIDDSKMRRGKESIQSKFGKDVAVYTGDYIIVKAFRFISEEKIEILPTFARGFERICEGEIIQNLNKNNGNITFKEYLKVISGKTATLFSMCAWAGAHIGNMEEKEKRQLASSGKHIGMAFQIMDDCRDYLGDEKSLQKKPGSDIENGIYTLPLILALKSKEIPNLREMMTEGKIEEIFYAIKKSNSIDEAKKIAQRYLNKAVDELNKVNNCEEILAINKLYKHMLKD